MEQSWPQEDVVSTHPPDLAEILDGLDKRCEALAREHEQGPSDGPHDPVTWQEINDKFVEAVATIMAEARRDVFRYFGAHDWEPRYMVGRLQDLLNVDPSTYAKAVVRRIWP
ncbi:MAG: hypothetical protein OXR82_09280 [Gammaproteobacteria bacterium]|nr:hypothetical protein [Gammaproteobacteria bacterium]